MRENPDHGFPTTPNGAPRVVSVDLRPVNRRGPRRLLPHRWEVRDFTVAALFLAAGIATGILTGVR